MSNFRIDHLDGPRFDTISGTYYGAGSARGTLSGGSVMKKLTAPRIPPSWRKNSERERKSRKLSEK